MLGVLCHPLDGEQVTINPEILFEALTGMS